MAKGYQNAQDVLTRTRDGQDLNAIWDAFAAILETFNAQRQPLVDLLSFNVTDVIEDIVEAGGERFEEVDMRRGRNHRDQAGRPVVHGLALFVLEAEHLGDAGLHGGLDLGDGRRGGRNRGAGDVVVLRTALARFVGRSEERHTIVTVETGAVTVGEEPGDLGVLVLLSPLA